MSHAEKKTTGAAAGGKTESPERRNFLRRFLGIGIMSCFFAPVRPEARPFPPSPSRKADFWRKGDRLAG
ncbi:MAG: hypothetical protein PHE84_06145 [bacterium]|nr:hypothetical protein [bacterium]